MKSLTLNGISDALWWLGDNERPRGAQLQTAFGLPYVRKSVSLCVACCRSQHAPSNSDAKRPDNAVDTAMAFRREDENKSIAVRSGAVHVYTPRELRSWWMPTRSVRLVDWPAPNNRLPSQERWYQNLDGTITDVSEDGSVRGKTTEGEDFEFTNRPAAQPALFSFLLFKVVVPLMILSPMIFCGTLTALHSFAAPPVTTADMSGLWVRLMHETFRCLTPPFPLEFPKLFLLFDLNNFLMDWGKLVAFLNGLIPMLATAMQSFSQLLSEIQITIDPLYFLDGSRALLSFNMFLAVAKPFIALLSSTLAFAMRLFSCYHEQQRHGPYRFADIAKQLNPDTQGVFIRSSFLSSPFRLLALSLSWVRDSRDAILRDVMEHVQDERTAHVERIRKLKQDLIQTRANRDELAHLNSHVMPEGEKRIAKLRTEVRECQRRVSAAENAVDMAKQTADRKDREVLNYQPPGMVQAVAQAVMGGNIDRTNELKRQAKAAQETLEAKRRELSELQRTYRELNDALREAESMLDQANDKRQELELQLGKDSKNVARALTFVAPSKHEPKRTAGHHGRPQMKARV